MEAKGNLVIPIIGARHAKGEVVENALVKPVDHRQAMRRSQINARLPSYVFDRLSFLRGDEIHSVPPSVGSEMLVVKSANVKT